jgi:hypothetical protein
METLYSRLFEKLGLARALSLRSPQYVFSVTSQQLSAATRGGFLSSSSEERARVRSRICD